MIIPWTCFGEIYAATKRSVNPVQHKHQGASVPFGVWYCLSTTGEGFRESRAPEKRKLVLQLIEGDDMLQISGGFSSRTAEDRVIRRLAGC